MPGQLVATEPRTDGLERLPRGPGGALAGDDPARPSQTKLSVNVTR
jgi:hypothetical protein